jgi:hypothetical protein
MRCRRFVIILVRVLVALITIQIRILVQQLQDYLSIRTKHARNVLTHLSTKIGDPLGRYFRVLEATNSVKYIDNDVNRELLTLTSRRSGQSGLIYRPCPKPRLRLAHPPVDLSFITSPDDYRCQTVSYSYREASH